MKVLSTVHAPGPGVNRVSSAALGMNKLNAVGPAVNRDEPQQSAMPLSYRRLSALIGGQLNGPPASEGPGHRSKAYRLCFGSTRLAATLLADGAPCFAIC